MSNARIPFVDLTAGIAPHRDEYLERIAKVLDSAYFAGGPAVAEFEQAFAKMCGAEHAVSVCTGTDALVLALRALGVEPGDEVIVPTNSFFATAEAVSLIGATPVFADVREDTLTIDVDDAATRVTDRTKVIIPVHLYGQIADMKAIASLASERGLQVLEDSAQAHGATRDGATAGSIGDAAGFSFYPTKNLGAFGEGGAVTTGSAEVAATLRRLRDHGQGAKNRHDMIGYNARLDAAKCTCLTVRVRHLPEVNAARRKVAARYRAGLADVPGLRLVAEDAGGSPVYHLFVVRTARRDELAAALAEQGISSAIHYPTPIHLQPAYAKLGIAEGSLPVAERAAREILSLPMFPELTDEQVDRVVAAVRVFHSA